MNSSRILFFISLFLTPFYIEAQDEIERAYNEQYEHNIALDYINNIYIPIDVNDALEQMDKLSDEEGRSRLLEADENLAAERLVYGLGKWMIVNWNFYEGSRLSHHLKTFGVTHPDDMAKFLIVSYHRHLRKVPLELKERGEQFRIKDKKEQEKRNLEKKVISGL